MIVLILYEENGQILVSHGVDNVTLRNIPLPLVPPWEIGKYDDQMCEWILK